MSTRVRVRLGDFALETLAAAGSRRVPLPERIEAAVRFYLGSSPSRPGWRYPPRLDEAGPPQIPGREIDLEIDSALWADVFIEAAAQRIDVAQLLAHAVLFCIADADASKALAL